MSSNHLGGVFGASEVPGGVRSGTLVSLGIVRSEGLTSLGIVRSGGLTCLGIVHMVRRRVAGGNESGADIRELSHGLARVQGEGRSANLTRLATRHLIDLYRFARSGSFLARA